MRSSGRGFLRRIALAAAAGALATASLGACGADGDPADPTSQIDDAGEPTATGPEDLETASPTPSPSSASPATTRPTSARPTSARGAFPPAVDPKQGMTYWAAVVTISEDPEDPTLAAAEDSLREVGYDAQGGDVDCLQGVRKLLGLPATDPYSAVAVLFKTEAQARQFDTAFGADLAGIGRVQAYCLDG